MPRNGRLPQKRLNFFVIDSRIIVTLGDSSNRLSPRNVSSILFSNSLFPTKPNSYKRKNHFYRYPVTIRFATSIRLIARKEKKEKKERKISNTKEFALIWIQNQVWSKREREDSSALSRAICKHDRFPPSTPWRKIASTRRNSNNRLSSVDVGRFFRAKCLAFLRDPFPSLPPSLSLYIPFLTAETAAVKWNEIDNGIRSCANRSEIKAVKETKCGLEK